LTPVSVNKICEQSNYLLLLHSLHSVEKKACFIG